jgi:hypothetical protein
VKKGDKIAFGKDLDKLISIVKDLGDPIDPVDIVQSDLIFPPEDLPSRRPSAYSAGKG